MINIKNIRFGYGKQPIFEDFSLELKKGETTLITGINGVGKTTLLRLMDGVLFPTKGEISYSPDMGRDPRSKIGFISDQMNLYENMRMSAAIRYHSDVYNIRNFDMELINKTRLKLDKRICDLSSGQKLIFHLSLILSARPEVLLIDEVIHSMDTFLREMFLNRLLELIDERQVTLVLVNLNFHDIEKITQRVILLKNGKIEVDDPIEQLKEKVKKVISNEEMGEFPVLYSRKFSDSHEYFIYPFDPGLKNKIKGQVVDLNLDDIIKAFIGGEYV